MDKKTAEDFVKRNRFCDHGHVVWTDDSEDEFGITLRSETLMEYPSVYEYAAAKALAWYPKRKREEIKSLRLAG